MEKATQLNKIFLKALCSLPAYFIIFCLLSPILFFCFYLKTWLWLKDFHFVLVFFMTLFQAGCSAVLSLLFALLGSLGLLAFAKKKYYFLIEIFIVLPALIPPLLLALSLVQLLKILPLFPFGLLPLILSQTLTYTGLCALTLTRVLLKHTAPLSEWAYLHGLSPFLFLKKLVSSVLLSDIKILFVLVFTSAFTSLSLPLLMGGSSFFSLEFFIYEQLKEPELWSKALTLILFQSIFIFLICWKAFHSSSIYNESISFKKVRLLEKKAFVFIPLIAVFLSVGGLFVLSDLSVFEKIKNLSPFILKAVSYSLLVSLMVGFITLLFLCALCFSYQNKKARRFIASFTAPGVSFVAFIFLIFPFYGEQAVLLKWVFGLSLLLFPWIYRYRGEKALERMNFHVKTARFLGADWALIFRRILWPSSRPVFFLCAGLASFWACGDFSYSLIVSSGHFNLSLLIYNLFSSYRLDEAILLSWLLLLLSCSVFLFWMSLSFLWDKKLHKKQVL